MDIWREEVINKLFSLKRRGYTVHVHRSVNHPKDQWLLTVTGSIEVYRQPLSAKELQKAKVEALEIVNQLQPLKGL